jgi:hypothetical protein
MPVFEEIIIDIALSFQAFFSCFNASHRQERSKDSSASTRGTQIKAEQTCGCWWPTPSVEEEEEPC